MAADHPDVVDAIVTGRVTAARALVFEYMASTQGETGQPVPDRVDELPKVLRDECLDLEGVYRAPGVLLLAYLDEVPVGCVGLRPYGSPAVAELKRLYVRPDQRRRGAAHSLLASALDHAAGVGFRRLVLDVLESRTQVVALYRTHGFRPIPPLTASVFPMVSLGREVPAP